MTKQDLFEVYPKKNLFVKLKLKDKENCQLCKNKEITVCKPCFDEFKDNLEMIDEFLKQKKEGCVFCKLRSGKVHICKKCEGLTKKEIELIEMLEKFK